MGAREELAAIRERVEAATEGPWEHVERRFDGGRVREHSVETHAHVIADDLSLNSAEFIAHARTDVPRLVAALEAVLEAHRPCPNTTSALHPEPLCTCDQEYPCPTVRAIEAALTTDTKGGPR